MMLDHYQQTKNLLVSYKPEEARLLLICSDLGPRFWDRVLGTALRAGCFNRRATTPSQISGTCHCFLRCRPA
jgi:hypothetical protein